MTSGTSPSYWLWWVDPIVTIARLAWIGVRIVRGRDEAVDEGTPTVEDVLSEPNLEPAGG